MYRSIRLRSIVNAASTASGASVAPLGEALVVFLEGDDAAGSLASTLVPTCCDLRDA